jgi:hypothetical protein
MPVRFRPAAPSITEPTVKVYNLNCEQQHAFEGWFASAEAFESQLAAGQVQCPVCDSIAITKALSAPRLNFGAEEPTPQRQEAAMPTAEQMQALFLKMAREIVSNTEDVGERFAEEARRIHYKEAPERGIRGVTSKDEADALEEEGIKVMPMPFGKLLKDPLQ